MNMAKAMKVLAIIAILGGAARIGMTPAALVWGTDSVQELAFGYTACLLMGIGIFGVYLHQSHRVGLVGLLSAILISISSTMTASLVWSASLGIMEGDHAYLATMQSANSLIMLLGMIGFCVQAIRVRIYPVLASVLFLAFPILSFIPVVSNWAATAWGLSYVIFGYYAWRNRTVKNETYVEAAA